MKKLRLILIVIAGLFVTGFVAWRIWFHNPYEDKLRLDPQQIFSEKNSAHSLMIRNATLIDVEAGKTVPNAHLLIRGDSIAEVFVDEEHEIRAGTKEYDAAGKFIMPGFWGSRIKRDPLHPARSLNLIVLEENPLADIRNTRSIRNVS